MKFVPKAKPVKIRIQSGGQEHSSLSTLRANFNLDDINKVCESESIIRWLRQQNENEICELLNSALSQDKNNEELYDLGILYAFFPDAIKNGRSINGIITYWAEKGYLSNIEHYLPLVYRVEDLEDIYKKSEGKIKNIIGARIGELYYKFGVIDKAANLGNKSALAELRAQMPTFTSNFSIDDISSFKNLIKNYQNGEVIDSTKHTTPVRNSAAFISLIQDIKSRSENLRDLVIFLSSDPRIGKKEWPEYLREPISYTMFAVHKYLGTNGVQRVSKLMGATLLVSSGLSLTIVPLGSIAYAASTLFSIANDSSSHKKNDIKIPAPMRNILNKIVENNQKQLISGLSYIAEDYLGLHIQ